MPRELFIYNTLTREKEKFEPLVPGHVGLYVCGPTVYGDPHLGHARPGVVYDVFVRLLRDLGYKVRYVRNITDVGHLENDSDSGEDKIGRKARLEELEPMEVVQYYTIRYHQAMASLNTLPPSIEPRASGHITEQIAMIQQILDAGMAYHVNGSVYFDVEKYNRTNRYGILSGRVLEDLLANTRELEGQGEKRFPFDFALWKKASPEHIMRWPSPWSEGFPGWHLECSVMSSKYLGQVFDIHGGGMDLLFPHHECELAQNTVTRGKDSVRYWMHNNLITINGQKMGKSLDNFITLEALFNGTHPLLTQSFHPMTIRFFILQAHYRGTLDFSNEALLAAGKGLKRLLQARRAADALPVSEEAAVSPTIRETEEKIYQALCDDMNTPIALAALFDLVTWINTASDAARPVSPADKNLIEKIYNRVVDGILGLKEESDHNQLPLIEGLVNMVLEFRNQARAVKNWAESDRIRDRLSGLGIRIKDSKEGTRWEL
ncbi:MAG TPA: cysteine--tRNA ligase [Bacteroidales bacterium]|jgi:cysteinyl-tRNA synthetase|nr:cysteine--tRNA ligase [Bacteroidales bacterium]OQB70888.1 MAG: Cysteine--tRNA ligase [Bacteroidetes bacterium ADurb.Bin139]MDD3521810.1 cysteine--tRNA ligase [Bacteroidales bacterium]MDD4436006.1 cysteine--tRNA ligase [Bacteroidales bacterium]HOG25897.1 cysteine--tRNA ligase [Bacteroidales bacterium]